MNSRRLSFVLAVLVSASLLASAADGRQFQPANKNVKIPKPVVPALFPSITDASYLCLGASGREFGVQGSGFGASQGTHRLLVNGTAIPSVYHWSANVISGNGPVWDVDHAYDVAIDDGSHVLSNVLNKRFLFQWDGAQPAHGAPGTEILLTGWGGGSAQTDKVIKLGSAVMAVVSWVQTNPSMTENNIRVRVPSLSPGTYPITIWKAGVNVTKAPLNFIVN